jgi:hypothetical protein
MGCKLALELMDYKLVLELMGCIQARLPMGTLIPCKMSLVCCLLTTAALGLSQNRLPSLGCHLITLGYAKNPGLIPSKAG